MRSTERSAIGRLGNLEQPNRQSAPPPDINWRPDGLHLRLSKPQLLWWNCRTKFAYSWRIPGPQASSRRWPNPANSEREAKASAICERGAASTERRAVVSSDHMKRDCKYSPPQASTALFHPGQARTDSTPFVSTEERSTVDELAPNVVGFVQALMNVQSLDSLS